ncbi:MAG: rhombosortase [Woeseiaceae bacterium]|nr:rhombosortase [Woeseiaceae bacterium]
MGLHLGEQKRLLVPFSLLLGAAVFGVFDDLGQAGFRLDRAAIADGEWYRLLTGHFVHLSVEHLLLNAAGLALVWFLVGGALSLAGWVVAALLSLVAVDIGLLAGVPELSWYVGLSGILHGLLAAGLVASWHLKRPELRALAAILVIKLGWESFFGPVPGSGSVAGGDVVTESHLFGAIGGAVAGLIYRLYNAPPEEQQRASSE